MPSLLIIDDNPAVATALEVLFSLHDISTLHAQTPEAGLAMLQTESVDLVIQDMNFTEDTTSGDEGVALFAQIRARHPDLPVILLTAWTHLSSAVELVKAGAADYVAKPWDDRKLLATVNNLLELAEARSELDRRRNRERARQEQLAQKYDLRGVVFDDPASERVIALACQVARSDLPVLITGPNGSGKEKIAEIVQANSSVKNGAFVTLNCGALPSELIEAELFGADAGAYTGANKAREGKFEAADGGTLFLDEIGNLPLAGQMKLLRVLETGRFERLGSNRERHVTRARDQRDQCGSARLDPRRQFSRRPLLPSQRHRAGAAAAGRTPGRHPAAGRELPSRRQADRRQRPQRVAAPPLARQCARTAQRRAARRTAGQRRPHRSGRPQPAQGQRR